VAELGLDTASAPRLVWDRLDIVTIAPFIKLDGEEVSAADSRDLHGLSPHAQGRDIVDARLIAAAAEDGMEAPEYILVLKKGDLSDEELAEQAASALREGKCVYVMASKEPRQKERLFQNLVVSQTSLGATVECQGVPMPP
jgi:hypothetical protein